jgi:hypothetical protein
LKIIEPNTKKLKKKHVIFKLINSLRRGHRDFLPRTLKGLVTPLGNNNNNNNNNNCHRVLEEFEKNTYTVTLKLIFCEIILG